MRPAGPIEVIGMGETSLISFLTDTLYHPELTINQGAVLGILLVLAGKTYCPQYCGGSTDVCILKTDFEFCNWLDAKQIESIEAFLRENQKRRLKTLLSEAEKIL